MLHLTSKINNETSIEIGKVILDIFVSELYPVVTWFTLCCNISQLCRGMRVCHNHFPWPPISVLDSTLVIVCVSDPRGNI